MKEWTKEFELDYWQSHDVDFYHDSVKLKWDLFGAEQALRVLFHNERIDMAIDIGGGRVGGALGFIEAENKLLVDALVDEFAVMGDLPIGVVGYCCDFARIALSSSIADVVCAWNVFDHAQNMDHFYQGVQEAIRLLKDGGVFLGTFPLRSQPREGHPIALDVVAVEKAVCELKLIRFFEVQKPFFDDRIIFVMAMKCE